MNTIEQIDAFFSIKNIAVVGASRDPRKFGNILCRELRQREYTVYPVNPNAEEIDREKCYSSLNEVKDRVRSALIITPRAQTENVVREALKAGIKSLWIQPGAETKEAILLCEESGVSCITNQCFFLFLKPVNGIHGFHRFFAGLFGALPK